MAQFQSRIGMGSFESVIAAATFEIAPTFDYPGTETICPRGNADYFLTIYEVLLFFVLFPKAAKFVAYELCNRLRLCLRVLARDEWVRYVDIDGYIFQRPTSDVALTREEYYDGTTPSLLHGPQANGGWALMARIATLIQPIGVMVTRDRAIAADLPGVDSQIFIPWHDPGYAIGEETEVTRRIALISSFMNHSVIPLLKTNMRQSSPVISAYSDFTHQVAAQADRVGNGWDTTDSFAGWSILVPTSSNLTTVTCRLPSQDLFVALTSLFIGINLSQSKTAWMTFG